MVTSAPCASCSPWRYSRQDSTLRRWDYVQLRWERVPTEDQVLSISNDTLFLTNGGFVLLPTGEDLTGIRDTVAGLYDIIMNGDINTANVLRIFVPTSAITSRGGDPKAPTDSIMTAVALAYQLAGQARPGSILVSQVAATSSNPSHQATTDKSSTPFNVWFWDGLRVTRINYGKIAVNIEDTLAGGLNTLPIIPAPDATEASILQFISDNYKTISMPNGTLLYKTGDGTDVAPDTIWMVLDNVSNTSKRVVLLHSKPTVQTTLSLPTQFSVVQGENIAVSWIAQAANLIFSGPTTGVASAPTFRSLVVNDLPNSGVTANTYASPSSVTVNAKGQITAITAGTAPVPDTIFYTLVHASPDEANINTVDGDGFLVPSSLNGATIVGVTYRSYSTVATANLGVAVNKYSTSGTSTNGLTATILLGDRLVETTGSFTINTGDYLRVWNNTSGDVTGLFATIKIVR